MDAIELLLNRVSVPQLDYPQPTPEQMEIMFKAALRAPDHARLRPWRFLTVSGDARKALGELFVKAAREEQTDPSDATLERVRNLPLRAPVLVMAICKLIEHPKVPEIEQKMSLAAAVHGLTLAAHAQGLGAMWRTGELCYHPTVANGLGLADNERLMGFIYLGTPSANTKKAPDLDVGDFVSSWGEELG